MEYIESNELLHCTGHIVPAEKAFKNRRLVLFYFGATWSATCRQFLHKLKLIYQKSKEIHLSLEIIYVSSDTDEETMIAQFTQRHGGWFAVRFGDPANWKLRFVYDIFEIPRLVVLNKDGEVVSRTGVEDYEKWGLDVLIAWNTLPPT